MTFVPHVVPLMILQLSNAYCCPRTQTLCQSISLLFAFKALKFRVKTFTQKQPPYFRILGRDFERVFHWLTHTLAVDYWLLNFPSTMKQIFC